MKVAITARMRNGILWDAVKQLGSQAELARYLGVAPWRLSAWLNFRHGFGFSGDGYRARREEIADKLLILTGYSIDEVFPRELESEAFKKRNKQIDVTVDVPMEQLIAAGAMPALPPAPDEFEKQPLPDVIDAVLETLTPREEKVIKLRFGLDGEDEHTYEEIGQKFDVSRERIRQIEHKALRKMRIPGRARKLKPFIEEGKSYPEVPKRETAEKKAEEAKRKLEEERERKLEKETLRVEREAAEADRARMWAEYVAQRDRQRESNERAIEAAMRQLYDDTWKTLPPGQALGREAQEIRERAKQIGLRYGWKPQDE